MKSFLIQISALILSLSLLCCSSLDDENIVSPIINDSDVDLGRLNAVKKAYQLTDLQYTPLKTIGQRSGTFKPGVTYKGVMYSSTKEIETYVGNDVSVHTMMTAIHNPRSKIYTEDISKPPYHGKNCRSYYGAVCSSFVSYALGIVPRYYANDFPLSNIMKEVDMSSLDNIQVADVLWKDGHVAMITDVVRDENNIVTKLEISECIGVGCKRYYRNRNQFTKLLGSTYKTIFRYSELYKNTDYTPIPEFVAVKDEIPMQFQYNDDLCVDKGDKSCYLEEEEVIINMMHPYDFVEIFKDDNYYRTIDTKFEDVKLTDLPYGDYKARIYFNGQYSDYTYWKVVNTRVVADKPNGKIYFSSANAIPKCLCFRDISGDSFTSLDDYMITETEKQQGYIVIQQQIKQETPYIRILFSTEYGVAINTPISWFD